MKYLSIDLETSGLDPETCQIIEFAAVSDDLAKPIDKVKKFQTYVLHETYTGEPYALAMHVEIFKKISDWKQGINKDIEICLAQNLMWNFYMFLMDEANYIPEDRKIKINVAGKNFNSFDKLFLQKLPNFDHQIHINRRVLDPAILYFDPFTDETLPSTEMCMKRADIEGKVAHTALEDAMMVVKLLRHKLLKTN